MNHIPLPKTMRGQGLVSMTFLYHSGHLYIYAIPSKNILFKIDPHTHPHKGWSSWSPYKKGASQVYLYICIYTYVYVGKTKICISWGMFLMLLYDDIRY